MYRRLLRMANRNAPALLSRALGLKKIDDLTSLIRDLVLEPSQVKEHTRLAVSEFDDLVSIHHELEDARQQRDVLIELPKISQELDQAQKDLKQVLAELHSLPIYFGEECARLWRARLNLYDVELLQLAQEMERLQLLDNQATERTQLLFHAYQSQGGERLEGLRKDLKAAAEIYEACTREARAYQMDARALGLAHTLTRETFNLNQSRAQEALADMPALRQGKQDHFAASAARFSAEQARLKALATEIHDIESRPDSNIDPAYQKLRDQLVQSLSLERSEVVFVGELLDVRDEQRDWRGAIERALGGHRVTLLVPEQHYRLVTRWLNTRHTGLYVRVQVVAHEHLNKGRFEKKDQQRIDDPRSWCLGFSNKNRLVALRADRSELEAELLSLGKQVETARLAMDELETHLRVWERIAQTDWTCIDVQTAQGCWQALKDDLQALEQPGSELGMAKSRWEQASSELKAVQEQKGVVSKSIGGLENNVAQARQ